MDWIFPLHFASSKPLTLSPYLSFPKKQMSSSRVALVFLKSFIFFPLPLEYKEGGRQKGKLPRSFKAELGKTGRLDGCGDHAGRGFTFTLGMNLASEYVHSGWPELENVIVG